MRSKPPHSRKKVSLTQGGREETDRNHTALSSIPHNTIAVVLAKDMFGEEGLIGAPTDGVLA